MANDPKFVRLVDRMARSTQVDLNSGWSIAGLDVKEFPADNDRAASYVRDAIRRGTIEGCSQAEYDEVTENDLDFLSQAGVKVQDVEVPGHFQEGHISALAEETRHSLESARGLSSRGVSYGDDRIRKKALLAAQKRLDDGAAPDEVEDEASGTVDEEEAAQENAKVQEEQEKAAASGGRRSRAGNGSKSKT
jgi:hypothetical protein